MTESPAAADRAPDPIDATRRWVERAVIGLNLCPFAKAVYVKQQVRFVLSDASTPEALLEELAEELLLLSPAQIEAAASVGRLGRLAERLVEERSWSSLDLLLTHAGLEVIPLEELASAARAVDRALARIPEARSTRATNPSARRTARRRPGSR